MPSSMPRSNKPGRKPLSSQWPPRMPSEWPAVIIRGPGVQPSSIAFRSAMSSNLPNAPTLRTVVKPDIKVARALATLRIEANDSKSLTAALSPAGSPSTRPIRCVCASMKPGNRVTSPRSIVLALPGILTDPAAPTAVILLSVTTTTALLIGAAPVPSISRAALNTTVPLPTGASGVIRVAGVCATTDTHSEWTRNNATAVDFKFFKVVPLIWS